MSTLRIRLLSLASLSAFAAAVLAGGCSRALDRGRIADAQLEVRVKTVLINDPDIGAHPLEVHVTGGVVRLSGRLDSDVQVQRSVDLARSVAGVTRVESAIVVGSDSSAPISTDAPSLVPVAEAPADAGDADRGRLAVGATLGWAAPAGSRLQSSIRVSPLVRLGSGSGLGITIGFGWFDADLHNANSPGRLGTLKVRPVMAGPGYTIRGVRASTTVSLVGGLALNGLEPDGRRTSGAVALKADNSLAWRPGVSVWVDLNSRMALNVFAGYLFTRPRTSFFEDGRVTTRHVSAHTGLIKVGVAYKVF